MCIKNLIVLTLLVVFCSSINFSQNYGDWTEIDSLNIARVGHAMVELPNGNVLVSGSEADSIQSSCEIYEISTGKWGYTTPMKIPRALHNLVLLNTGKVLAIGGYKEQSCELFDPNSETWIMTDSIPTFRFTGQTVTELSDGRIMVVGGYYVDTTSWDFIILNKVDIYDPEAEIWFEATPMNLGRYEHTATLLNDGRVLVAGGNTKTFQTAECEIYSPLNNTWSIISTMIEPRYSHAAILLNNGNVFISSGDPSSGYSCEVFDITNNQWRRVGDIQGYRSEHRLYYLSKVNKLLILGGDALPPSTEDTWEIYDPNALVSLYYESFPINQFLFNNNIQLFSEKIMIAGSEEYDLYPIPHTWPSKRCWIFDVTTEVNKDNEEIKSFMLNQNFPNPFNPTTTIQYQLPLDAKVTLKIYDILGSEVATLVNEEQEAGYKELKFNGINYASGMYVYRLTADSYVSIKKMMMVK